MALETYFQTNFKYDETADYSTASNGPLPAFFLGDGKNGYCQMFSGSMATILRMLGIPARVAEGFTPGKLDPRSRPLRGDRPRRARLGRGLLPGLRLAALRADPVARPRRPLLRHVERLRRRGTGRRGRLRAAGRHPARARHARPRRRRRRRPRPVRGGRPAAERHRRSRGRARRCDRARGRRRRLAARHRHVPDPGRRRAVRAVPAREALPRAARLPAARPAPHRGSRPRRPAGVGGRPGHRRRRPRADARTSSARC